MEPWMNVTWAWETLQPLLTNTTNLRTQTLILWELAHGFLASHWSSTTFQVQLLVLGVTLFFMWKIIWMVLLELIPYVVLSLIRFVFCRCGGGCCGSRRSSARSATTTTTMASERQNVIQYDDTEDYIMIRMRKTVAYDLGLISRGRHHHHHREGTEG